MQLTIESPSRAYLSEFSSAEILDLRRELSYVKESVRHQLKRTQQNHWFRSQNPEGWQKTCDELKSQINQVAMWTDNGRPYIRPGSIPFIEGKEWNIQSKVQYPKFKKIPWAKPLPFQLHPYQEESWDALLAHRHANVALCTGSGKSPIILKVCREAGLSAAIIAPSKSIFYELKEKFEYHFGKQYVGAFGDSKKVLGKRFTICISDSLCNLKPGTKEYDFFSKLDMMLVDESHTFAAETLEEVCHGVLKDVPYRFFFSATQTRGDGTEKLLQSIIGETVCELSTGEAVEKGYIADHEFRVVAVRSTNLNYSGADPLEEKRVHFLRNQNIANFIAKFANADATINGKQTLVLVEEMSQVAALAKLLTVPFAYAHSEKNKDRLEELGLQKVDPAETVEKFNKNEAKVLIGTSCVSTGTNIFPTHNVFNWVGGSSEIKTKQGAVGRAVRKHEANPWKELCVYKDKAIIFDFDIVDVPKMAISLEKRLDCYKESNRPIKYIRTAP